MILQISRGFANKDKLIPRASTCSIIVPPAQYEISRVYHFVGIWSSLLPYHIMSMFKASDNAIVPLRIAQSGSDCILIISFPFHPELGCSASQYALQDLDKTLTLIQPFPIRAEIPQTPKKNRQHGKFLQLLKKRTTFS